MKTACATINGFEAMRVPRKKQAGAIQLQSGIRGEVRLVERAFGTGPDMMSEPMSLHGAELERVAIQQGFRDKAEPSHALQLWKFLAAEPQASSGSWRARNAKPPGRQTAPKHGIKMTLAANLEFAIVNSTSP